MKTLRNKFWALLLITSVAFLSCKKQDQLVPVKPANTNTSPADNPNFTRGEWKVEMLKKNGVDETVNLRGYLFKFNEDRTVSVRKDNNTVTGTWSMIRSNSQKTFMLTFSSDPLNELNGDWEVMYETDVNLGLERKMSDDSVDNLTFGRYFAQGTTGTYN
ncbi:MAG: hypothetical protein K0S53_2851 [Bacteroidetes bacterium]|jgi:hypothetical protein|nr:hypothetical protein [Bacteroidota bacterium]MDF2453513.1 hypothetical protein [Bacteroidota bacterium]